MATNNWKEALKFLNFFAQEKTDGEEQEDILFHHANAIFMNLAHDEQDSTLNGLTGILRKLRKSEDHDG